jgi:hypothetical protein
MAEVETQDPGLRTGALIGFIAAFVVVGAPLVYYLWTTINELLAGHFDAGRLLGTAGILLIFLLLLGMLSRAIRRIDVR